MDKEQILKIIKKYIPRHEEFAKNAEIAQRYYSNKNDILYTKKEEDEQNPLRNADNRIPRNFHGLLVNQKASYLFTAPPTFDVASVQGNKKIAEVLGDRFSKVCKDLCIDASNSGVAWLHFWKDDTFKYAAVKPQEIMPIWSNNLEQRLVAVIRGYKKEEAEKTISIYEYWTETQCFAFRLEKVEEGEQLLEYNMFAEYLNGIQTGETNLFSHDFGIVPFIPFLNNNLSSSDLDNIKPLIDTYDKVYSGFTNDLEDIQEVIFVLSGYGGTDKATFVSELKQYKMIDLQNDDASDKSGLTTLTIEIPVEAREKLLDMTRKAIFEQGQGVDPQPESFGNASGVALKYLYSLLELKAGLMETEFKLAFGSFVRVICQYIGVKCNRIIQTWTRTAITNDLELADIASKSTGIISELTVFKNHPWVEDAEAEMKQLKKEQQEAIQKQKETMQGMEGYGQQPPEGGEPDGIE